MFVAFTEDQSITTGSVVGDTGGRSPSCTLRGSEFGSAFNADPNSLPNLLSVALESRLGSIVRGSFPLFLLHAESEPPAIRTRPRIVVAWTTPDLMGDLAAAAIREVPD